MTSFGKSVFATKHFYKLWNKVTLPEIRLKPMELPMDFFSRSFAAIFPNGCKSINITDGIYRILKKKKTVWWHGSFCGWFYWWNYRGIQTGIFIQWRDLFTGRIVDGITDGNMSLVIPSVKVNISPRCRPSPPLSYFSFFFPTPATKQTLPSQTTSNHPPKHPSLLNTIHPSLFF